MAGSQAQSPLLFYLLRETLLLPRTHPIWGPTLLPTLGTRPTPTELFAKPFKTQLSPRRLRTIQIWNLRNSLLRSQPLPSSWRTIRSGVLVTEGFHRLLLPLRLQPQINPNECNLCPVKLCARQSLPRPIGSPGYPDKPTGIFSRPRAPSEANASGCFSTARSQAL